MNTAPGSPSFPSISISSCRCLRCDGFLFPGRFQIRRRQVSETPEPIGAEAGGAAAESLRLCLAGSIRVRVDATIQEPSSLISKVSNRPGATKVSS